MVAGLKKKLACQIEQAANEGLANSLTPNPVGTDQE